MEHILGDEKRTLKQNIDQSNHYFRVESKGTKCDKLNSAQLKSETIIFHSVETTLFFTVKTCQQFWK